MGVGKDGAVATSRKRCLHIRVRDGEHASDASRQSNTEFERTAQSLREGMRDF